MYRNSEWAERPSVTIPIDVAYIIAGLLPEDRSDHSAVQVLHEAIKAAEANEEEEG